MKDNLNQWAGQIQATADLMATVTLVTDLSYEDKILLRKMADNIAITAKSFSDLVQSK